MNRSNIVAAMALLSIACGTSGTRGSASTTSGAPESSSSATQLSRFEGQHFAAAKGVAIDPGAAKLLPAVVAGALTVRNLASIVNRAGLDNRASSKLHLLREELIAWLGFDLLAGRRDGSQLGKTADAMGLDANAPITLAWLSADGSHPLLIVTVTDAVKLRRALGGRPAIIAEDRMLLGLGTDAATTRRALAKLPAELSLANSGKLSVFDTLAYGDDAALYLSGEAYKLGAETIAIGMTLKANSLHTKAAVHFSVPAPAPTAWASRLAKRLSILQPIESPEGVDAGHELIRELEQGSAGSQLRLAASDILKGLGFGNKRRQGHQTFSEKLGTLAMAARTQGGDLIFYGGLAFNGASAADLGNLGARVAGKRLRNRPARARELALNHARNNGILARLKSNPPGDLDEIFGSKTHKLRGGFTKSRPPQVRPGLPKASGDLSKDVIRRYIRRQLKPITRCYEKELLVDPKLRGTVVASFTIKANGAVSASKAKGVNHRVASCVALMIAQIKFPRPRGGGLVRVRYPFTFAPGSSATGGSWAGITGTVGTTTGGYGVGVGGGGGGGGGKGGGGTGWGTIGTGSYGTVGTVGTVGTGGRSPGGYGRGMKGRRAGAPRVRLGKSSVQGALDKNIIRRYIRRQLARIRHCYEKQYVSDSKLRGRVTVRFTIAADGTVSSATAKGVHKAVASCVSASIRLIRFPKPRGGGVVRVSYPFNFSPG